MTSTPSRSARLAALGLAVVFLVAGAAIGVSVDRLWIRGAPSSASDTRHPHKRHTIEDIVAHMRQRLALTDAQVRSLEPVVAELIREIEHLKGDHHRKAFEIHKRMQSKILAILEPDQANEYRRWVAEKMTKLKHIRRLHDAGHHGIDPHGHGRHHHSPGHDRR